MNCCLSTVSVLAFIIGLISIVVAVSMEEYMVMKELISIPIASQGDFSIPYVLEDADRINFTVYKENFTKKSEKMNLFAIHNLYSYSFIVNITDGERTKLHTLNETCANATDVTSYDLPSTIKKNDFFKIYSPYVSSVLQKNRFSGPHGWIKLYHTFRLQELAEIKISHFNWPVTIELSNFTAYPMDFVYDPVFYLSGWRKSNKTETLWTGIIFMMIGIGLGIVASIFTLTESGI